MTIANAMRKFFLKLNGTAPTGNTIAEVIENGAASVQVNNESALATRLTTAEEGIDSLRDRMPVNPVTYFSNITDDKIIISNITVGETHTTKKQYSIKVSDEGVLSTELEGTSTYPNETES